MVEKKKIESPEERSKRKRDRELNDIRKMVSFPEGRRFIWRLLSEGKIFTDGYVHGDDGYGTTFNAGRRNVGVWVLSEIMTAKPDVFMQMQREDASEKKREEMDIKEFEDGKDILKTDT